ncbi:MAG TPA: pitrilysin family protein [Candidatus Limnocylindrales bacterium]|nr:pitrilysin family protein [Candidatus Limnocylindrales bacterium]
MFHRGFALCAAIIVAAAAATAQQAAPTANQSAPATQTQKNQKEGTGVVPPGVKLAPQMPAGGAPRPFEFPDAVTKTLPNGMRVFVVSDSREPAVAVRMVILSAGSVQDPAGMPGVAQMTATMLTQGTAKRSARDIAEAIDFVGGQLSAEAGKDATTVTLAVVKKDLSVGLDLMSDVVLHPAFRAEELDRQRQQLLSSLTVQYSDPDYLASAVFAREIYSGSPYGMASEGTPESVRKLRQEQLAKFHDENYAPNRALLAFAGDIKPEEAFAAAEKYFGEWPKAAAAMPAPPAPAPVSGRHIWLIDLPDAKQTQVRVGKLGIRRGDPDLVPLQVTNRIFGGGYNSRLNTEVRIKKGLTYGAFSIFSPHRYAGSFGASTFTRTEATVEATKLVVDLISRMSTGDVTPQELDFARDYLAGVYPIQTETPVQVADRVLTVAAFDLPADYNRTYPQRIRSITATDAKAMAQKYFQTKDLDLVLAGNVGAFRDALKKEFPDAQYTEIPADQLDLLAPDLRKPKTAAQPATPESFDKGKELLLAAASATGGDKLTSVTSIGMTEIGKMFTGQGEMPVHVDWTVAYPNRSRGDVTLGTEHIVQICDGQSAWLQFPDRTIDTTKYLDEFERGLSLFGGGWGIYEQVLGGKIMGQMIGEDQVGGKPVVGVALNGQFNGVKLYFDSATHLLAAARYQSMGPQGPLDNEQRWSDYRTVEGRQFAYTTVIYRNGSRFLESTVQNVTVNPKVDDSIFSRPTPAPPPPK